MNKTIGQIYIDLHVIQNLNDFYYGLTQEKAFTLQKMINMTYSELFNSYITSQRFKEDCESIRMKEGEKFEILYKYVSKIYIKYYSLSKGNKPKRLDREEKIPKRKRKFFNVKKNKLSTYSDVLLLRNCPDNIFKVELIFIVVI